MSSSHIHQHVDAPVSAPVRRAVIAAVIAVGLITVLGLIALWPRESVATNPTGELTAGSIVAVHECQQPARDCSRLTLRVQQGPSAGKEFRSEVLVGQAQPDLPEGTEVWLIEASPGEFEYADIRRDRSLLWIAVVFAIAVIAFARWKGVAALAGLLSSLLVLLWFVLPALLLGSDPVAVAAVGAAAIAIVSMGFAHGVKVQTGVALVGTIVALLLTLALGSVFSGLASITGLGSESAYFLDLQGLSFDLRGLFLAGLIIGALGVLDDVTVTQAAAVSEVKQADPSLGWRDLFGSGMRVGRDHVAATVNTLVLAYVGASLPLFLLLTMADAPLFHTINGEAIAQEIVRALVGGMGIIAAVPITTALMALVLVESEAHPGPAGASVDPKDTDRPSAVSAPRDPTTTG